MTDYKSPMGLGCKKGMLNNPQFLRQTLQTWFVIQLRSVQLRNAKPDELLRSIQLVFRPFDAGSLTYPMSKRAPT